MWAGVEICRWHIDWRRELSHSALAGGRRGKGAENGRACVHVQRRPPALIAVRQSADFDRQCHGLRMPLCALREVQSTSRPPNLTHYPFEPCLTKSRLTGQVSRCLWRRGRRSCPPKPTDTRCQFLLMHGGGLYGGMTKCRREKRGNAAGQSALALLFGSYVDGLGRGAVFLCDVDAGCPWRSKVVMGASVHKSRNAAGRAKPKQKVL